MLNNVNNHDFDFSTFCGSSSPIPATRPLALLSSSWFRDSPGLITPWYRDLAWGNGAPKPPTLFFHVVDGPVPNKTSLRGRKNQSIVGCNFHWGNPFWISMNDLTAEEDGGWKEHFTNGVFGNHGDCLCLWPFWSFFDLAMEYVWFRSFCFLIRSKLVCQLTRKHLSISEVRCPSNFSEKAFFDWFGTLNFTDMESYRHILVGGCQSQSLRGTNDRAAVSPQWEQVLQTMCDAAPWHCCQSFSLSGNLPSNLYWWAWCHRPILANQHGSLWWFGRARFGPAVMQQTWIFFWKLRLRGINDHVCMAIPWFPNIRIFLRAVPYGSMVMELKRNNISNWSVSFQFWLVATIPLIRDWCALWGTPRKRRLLQDTRFWSFWRGASKRCDPWLSTWTLLPFLIYIALFQWVKSQNKSVCWIMLSKRFGATSTSRSVGCAIFEDALSWTICQSRLSPSWTLHVCARWSSRRCRFYRIFVFLEKSPVRIQKNWSVLGNPKNKPLPTVLHSKFCEPIPQRCHWFLRILQAPWVLLSLQRCLQFQRRWGWWNWLSIHQLGPRCCLQVSAAQAAVSLRAISTIASNLKGLLRVSLNFNS